MSKVIAECVNQLNKQVLEKEKQKLLVKHFDVSEIIDEDIYCELCQTPLSWRCYKGEWIADVKLKDMFRLRIYANFPYPLPELKEEEGD